MKLNLGAGKMRLPGFISIDIQPHPKMGAPDIIADVRKVPLQDGYADEVHAYHVIEHFARYEANELVGEWRRLLKEGGLLVLELPNLEAACRNLLAGMTDQMAMWPIYGDWNHRDPYMLHKHGYTPASIRALLVECGLKDIRVLPPQTHGRRANRDMRVEARK